MTQIREKTILITGGASGIGRRLALESARQGARVVLWDLDENALGRTLEDLRQAGPEQPRGYLCNVADRRQVYETAQRVGREAGPVEILVNNAGCVSGRPLLECTDEQIQRTMEVNALAHFWTVKAFLPSMIAAGSGHIVTIASAAGVIGVAGLSDYCASKWAAVGFNESLRVEFKRGGCPVRTTVVCPFFVNTGMFAGVRSRVSWLLPILDEQPVAERILRAVRRNHAQVFLPPLVGWVPLLRGLPASWFDALSNLLGVNRAMATFVGRPPGSRAD
ncbi:MAG: SDR family oxidoreductase [Thermoguttaceae bacterium]